MRQDGHKHATIRSKHATNNTKNDSLPVMNDAFSLVFNYLRIFAAEIKTTINLKDKKV